jgi:hypothetical protein
LQMLRLSYRLLRLVENVVAYLYLQDSDTAS